MKTKTSSSSEAYIQKAIEEIEENNKKSSRDVDELAVSKIISKMPIGKMNQVNTMLKLVNSSIKTANHTAIDTAKAATTASQAVTSSNTLLSSAANVMKEISPVIGALNAANLVRQMPGHAKNAARQANYHENIVKGMYSGNVKSSSAAGKIGTDTIGNIMKLAGVGAGASFANDFLFGGGNVSKTSSTLLGLSSPGMMLAGAAGGIPGMGSLMIKGAGAGLSSGGSLISGAGGLLGGSGAAGGNALLGLGAGTSKLGALLGSASLPGLLTGGVGVAGLIGTQMLYKKLTDKISANDPFASKRKSALSTNVNYRSLYDDPQALAQEQSMNAKFMAMGPMGLGILSEAEVLHAQLLNKIITNTTPTGMIYDYLANNKEAKGKSSNSVLNKISSEWRTNDQSGREFNSLTNKGKMSSFQNLLLGLSSFNTQVNNALGVLPNLFNTKASNTGVWARRDHLLNPENGKKEHAKAWGITLNESNLVTTDIEQIISGMDSIENRQLAATIGIFKVNQLIAKKAIETSRVLGSKSFIGSLEQFMKKDEEEIDGRRSFLIDTVFRNVDEMIQKIPGLKILSNIGHMGAGALSTAKDMITDPFGGIKGLWKSAKDGFLNSISDENVKNESALRQDLNMEYLNDEQLTFAYFAHTYPDKFDQLLARIGVNVEDNLTDPITGRRVTNSQMEQLAKERQEAFERALSPDLETDSLKGWLKNKAGGLLFGKDTRQNAFNQYEHIQKIQDELTAQSSLANTAKAMPNSMEFGMNITKNNNRFSMKGFRGNVNINPNSQNYSPTSTDVQGLANERLEEDTSSKVNKAILEYLPYLEYLKPKKFKDEIGSQNSNENSETASGGILDHLKTIFTSGTGLIAGIGGAALFAKKLFGKKIGKQGLKTFLKGIIRSPFSKSNLLGWAAMAVAGVGLIAMDWEENVKWVSDKWNQFSTSVGEISDDISNWWNENVTKRIDEAGIWINQTKMDIVNWYDTNIENPISDSYTKIKENTTKLINGVKNYWDDSILMLEKLNQKILDSLSSSYDDAADWVKEKLGLKTTDVLSDKTLSKNINNLNTKSANTLASTETKKEEKFVALRDTISSLTSNNKQQSEDIGKYIEQVLSESSKTASNNIKAQQELGGALVSSVGLLTEMNNSTTAGISNITKVLNDLILTSSKKDYILDSVVSQIPGFILGNELTPQFQTNKLTQGFV